MGGQGSGRYPKGRTVRGFTVREISKLTGHATSTIHKHINNPKLKAEKEGSQWRMYATREEILDYFSTIRCNNPKKKFKPFPAGAAVLYIKQIREGTMLSDSTIYHKVQEWGIKTVQSSNGALYPREFGERLLAECKPKSAVPVLREVPNLIDHRNMLEIKDLIQELKNEMVEVRNTMAKFIEWMEK